MQDQSLRNRDRAWYQTRTSAAPYRAPRRVKVHPVKGIPCRVKAPTGEYYDLDSVLNILEINGNNPEGHVFKSRNKASGRVYQTIRRYLAEGDQWDEKRYFLENVA